MSTPDDQPSPCSFPLGPRRPNLSVRLVLPLAWAWLASTVALVVLPGPWRLLALAAALPAVTVYVHAQWSYRRASAKFDADVATWLDANVSKMVGKVVEIPTPGYRWNCDLAAYRAAERYRTAGHVDPDGPGWLRNVSS